jgi:hypothetical protein
MYTREDILNYHCPRWSELPDIDLYMDQVVSLIVKNTSVFSEDDDQRAITKTMINNYVKLKLIKPPKNKRYDRVHLAYFMVVAILKRFMSLTEIAEGIKQVKAVYTTQQAYDLFCEIFELSLRSAFDESFEGVKISSLPDDIAIYHAVTSAYSNMLYARYLISKNNEKAEKASKAEGTAN